MTNTMNKNERFEFEITELRLGLPGGRPRCDNEEEKNDQNIENRVFSDKENDEIKKGVAVGWPPLCSYRRKSIGSEKDCVETSKKLVKISMDGVPFLRKIDVGGYKDYSQLIAAFQKLFGCAGLKEALEDPKNRAYVVIYEDPDGDWLLVGDVPWNMFVESCKRLRIMKSADVKGFQGHSKKNFR